MEVVNMQSLAVLIIACATMALANGAGHHQGHMPTSSLTQHLMDENKLVAHIERVARQLPSLWNSWGHSGLSRQIFDMIDIISDVAMLTVLGIPILGLVAFGATAFSPLLGAAGGSGRKKRDTNVFADRAGRALNYAGKMYELLSKLEEAFLKYDIKEDQCQLRAVCEVHKVGPNSDYKDFGNKIIELIKIEKELEETEVIPVAKLLFSVYGEAAKHGLAQDECGHIYRQCDTELIAFIERAKKTKSASTN